VTGSPSGSVALVQVNLPSLATAQAAV